MKPHRPKHSPLKPLSHFAVEQNVPKESVLWPHITAWQRQGFVSLRWSGTSAFCNVKLTDAGRAEIARLETEKKG